MKLPTLEEIQWIHNLRFPDGTSTNGKWKLNEKEYGLDRISYKNKRVLDIGCLDGLYTFYVEEKGAKEVVAIDINEEQFGRQKYKDKNWSYGFLYAHKKLKSKAKYIFPFSLYDLNTENFGKFDIVLYLGVNYHILHPILALEKINEVLHKGGIVIFESEISNTYTKFYHKKAYATVKQVKKEKVTRTVSRLSDYYKKALNLTMLEPSDIGKAIINKIQLLFWTIAKVLFEDSNPIYKRDISNFWIMDTATIEKILDVSGFAVMHKISQPFGSRVTYICKKIDNYDDSYGAKSKYSDYKDRISNITKYKTINSSI